MQKMFFYIMAIMLAFAACQKKEEPAPQYSSGPIQGQIQGSVNEANMLREAVQKDPNNLAAWIKLGNLMMDTSRFTEAVDAYQKALAIDPKNVDVRVDMGTCYRYSGKPDIAIKEYRKAIELNPNHLNAHKNLGVVLANDLKDNKEAVKEFNKYLQLSPNAPDADQIKGEIQKLN